MTRIQPNGAMGYYSVLVARADSGIKDIKDLKFGLENDVDWVALSFVRSEHDILELKDLIKKDIKK